MDLEYLDNMLPWEKEVYIVLLKNWIEEEKIRLETKAKQR